MSNPRGPSVRVRRRSTVSSPSSPSPAPNAAVEQRRAHADDLLNREAGHAHGPLHHAIHNKHPDRDHRRHGIVEGIASRHRAIAERRAEERRVRRLNRFAAIGNELQEIREAQEDGRGNVDEDSLKESASRKRIASRWPFGRSGHRQEASQRPTGRTKEAKRSTEALTASLRRGPTRNSTRASELEDEHSWEAVEVLDVIDPRVGTVAVLSDITRSIFVPAALAGSEPIVDLPSPEERLADDVEGQLEGGGAVTRARTRKHVDSADESAALLDSHVEHLLTKRQQRIALLKKVLSGVWTFMKTPLGIIVSIYGFLVVFTGAALVICLFGWVPGNKDLQVEAFSQAINGLFTITGVGLIPWRVRDTYRMSRICHYRNLTWRLRRERGLPPLKNREDLAEERLEQKYEKEPSSPTAAGEGQAGNAQDQLSTLPSIDHDAEHVLKPRQAERMMELQSRFAASATWYRYTETSTHTAFPISMAVAITALNVGNSIFQCCLCAAMWGYAGPEKYHDRPAWMTALGIVLSFSCGIAAAVLIAVGGKQTKKTKEVEERLKAAFARDADETVPRGKEDVNASEDSQAGEAHRSSTDEATELAQQQKA
ncbi:hypothetical protein IE81DRAFT_325073 [Ceraceosorus guamensis]|uniref:Uncharacterized protein n=1 Tax=Ceraceosorus guamensis TaxID=1522189 RepID=A0A316VTS2_9BASI|nr:hypothetical protein IE81DRAFT_325073 [Ceraceosorus guamensis]PWN40979.1 hypothetical protein IE81DRAFT_325073 [Ceraceosorus guamensis]